MSLNSVILQGNLVADPELRYGKTQTAVCKFAIGVNTGSGDYKQTAFVDCVSFGKQGEALAKHFVKGKEIIVSGQLIQNRWETDEGDKRSRMEVRLNTFNGWEFVGSKGSSDNEASDEPVAAAAGDGDTLL